MTLILWDAALTKVILTHLLPKDKKKKIGEGEERNLPGKCDSFNHRFHKVKLRPKYSWFPLGFKSQPVIDLKLCSLQQALGDQVKN